MAKQWINSKTHKQFLAGLELSKVAVWLAAQILEDEGHSPKVNHTKAAPTHKVRGKFIDDGDIIIDEGPVEVKWFTGDRYSFTDKKSWKYPYVIVCPQKRWHYQETPVRWMYFNNKLTHYIQFRGDAVDKNNVKEIMDTRYRVKNKVIVAENKSVVFLPVPSHIIMRYKTVSDVEASRKEIKKSYATS